MAESITITDNRTGESVEVPILNGGVDAVEWRKLLPGVWFHDPGFMTTSVTTSGISFVDGDEGVLLYRGYPIEQLAEHSNYLEVAYLLLQGELPNKQELDEWLHQITVHTYLHENMRKRFVDGFHYDAHPMGMLVSGVAALSTFYEEAKQIEDPEVRRKQIIRLVAKMPTLAALNYRFYTGMPFLYPGELAQLHRQLPADDVLAQAAGRGPVGEPGARPRARRAVHPPCGPRAELLDHGHASRRVVARRPLHRVCGGCGGAVRAPARRRQRAGHPDAHRRSGRSTTSPTSCRAVKAGEAGRLQGFGHRVYKNYDPRATIIKQHADEVFEITGKNPLLDIALKLEEVALSDEYFTSRRLYPNVDFYSGLIYQAMGFPVDMFPVLFAIPRTTGWLAHWEEMLEQGVKIARPRQLYVGEGQRDYTPLDQRG